MGRRQAFTRIHQAFAQRQSPEALLELIQRLSIQNDDDDGDDDEDDDNMSY